MKKLLDSMRQQFDYIILDCPAGIEQGFLNTLTIATKALIVLNNELTAQDAVSNIAKTINTALDKYNKANN